MQYINNLYELTKSFFYRYYKFIILFLFGLTIFTSLFKLDSVPYGLHVDEAGMAYDAFCLSEYGVDRYLNRFPVYLINYGGGQSALYAYFAAIFIKLFGFSTFVIRLPAVILRLCIFVCGFYIVKNEKSRFKTFTFLFLITIVPYFIMQSRFGLDCNLLVGFITISICFLIQSLKKNSNLWLIISGVFFGLSLYTYALSYIIIPILLFFICVYLLYSKKINFKKVIILGIPIFLFALPLMLMILVNNGLISEINGFITIPLLETYRGTEISLSNVFKNLYILISVLSFDNPKIFGNLLYNSIPYFGTIYYFTIPFFIVGIIVCFRKFYFSVKKKDFDINILFVFWFLSVLICQLLIENPNINKANAIFVPIIYFSATGIVSVIKKFKFLCLPIFLIFLINFGLFFNYYFYHFNEANTNQFLFANDYIDAIEYSKTLGKEHIYIETELTSQEYIYILLFNFVSPYEYSKDNIQITYNNTEVTYTLEIPQNIDLDGVYIVGGNETLLNKLSDLGFSITKFGYISVLQIN